MDRISGHSRSEEGVSLGRMWFLLLHEAVTSSLHWDEAVRLKVGMKPLSLRFSAGNSGLLTQGRSSCPK